MSAGHIRPPGPGSWELKFDADRDPTTGRRKTKYVTFKGTKKEAQVELARLIAAVGDATYIELVENQIAPHIGAKPVQKLKVSDIEAWHHRLRTSGRKDGKGGISTRTIKHAHRVLSQAFDDAVRNDLVAKNVAKLQGVPRVDETEVQVVPKERIGELIDKLRGRSIYARATTSLFTGLRRGELLAPLWRMSTSTPRSGE
jgi:integrase